MRSTELSSSASNIQKLCWNDIQNDFFIKNDPTQSCVIPKKLYPLILKTNLASCHFMSSNGKESSFNSAVKSTYYILHNY